MIKYISTPEYVTWGIIVVLQAVLVDIIFKYRHHKEFPAFATYISFTLFNSLLLIVLSVVGGKLVYFYTYWAGQVLVFALLFCVVHEVFESVTDRGRRLSPPDKKVLIRIATLFAAVAVAASMRVPESRFPLMAGIASLQRGLGLAIFSFMAVLVISARAYSVNWYRRDSGIAIGIFIDFAFQTLWPHLNAFLPGTAQIELYKNGILLCELLATTVWLYSFIRGSQLEDYIDSPVLKRNFKIIVGGKYRKHHYSAELQVDSMVRQVRRAYLSRRR